MLKATISGQSELTFSKVVFSSDDLTQSSDADIANLTDIQTKDLTAPAQTFVGTDGTTKIRAIADNQSSNQAFYIKDYALYAKQNGTESLFAVSISDSTDFVPAYNAKQLSQIAYTFNIGISDNANITLSDVHDIPVSQADIKGVTTYVDSKASKLTDTINQTAQSTLSSANAYTDKAVADKATHDEVTTAKADLQTSINSNSSAISSNAVNIANNSNAISSNANLTSQAVTQINNNISNVQGNVTSLNNHSFVKYDGWISGYINTLDDLLKLPNGFSQIGDGPFLPDGSSKWGMINKFEINDVFITYFDQYNGAIWTIAKVAGNWTNWKKLGGVTPNIALNSVFRYHIDNGDMGNQNPYVLFRTNLKANHVYWIGIDSNQTIIVSYDGNINNAWSALNQSTFTNSGGDCYAVFGLRTNGDTKFSNFRIYDVTELKAQKENQNDLDKFM